jgi:hypothetical protein
VKALAVTVSSLKAQTGTAQGAADSSKELEVGRDAKSDWDAQDVSFRRRRSEAAVLLNAAKKDVMSSPGGCYNYLEQMSPIRDRYLRDLRDAFTRLGPAQRGMRRIREEEQEVSLLDMASIVVRRVDGVEDTLQVGDSRLTAIDHAHVIMHPGDSIRIKVPYKRTAGDRVWLVTNGYYVPIQKRRPYSPYF